MENNDIKKKFTLLKLKNCLDKDNEIINAEDVKKIIPVIDKKGLNKWI